MVTKKGIDISHWNNDAGPLDWARIRSSGISFVIIKAGGSDAGFYKDKNFEENYRNATAAGLDVGAYYFIGPKMLTKKDAEADAERFYQIIKGKRFSMPIYLDLETSDPKDRVAATKAAAYFCKYLEKLGYFVGIYASDLSGFRDRCDGSKLTMFTLWVARYGKEPSRAWDVWQYSSTGSVPGIRGNVDLNYMSRDLPTIIRKAHKNGY